MPTCCVRPKLILVFPESSLHWSPGQSLPKRCSLPEALGAQLHTHPKVLHLFLFPSSKKYVPAALPTLSRRVWLCCQGGVSKQASLKYAHQLLHFLKPFEKLQTDVRCEMFP